MPVVSSPNLTLTTSEGQVTVRVRYDVTFNAFERSLAGLGKTWHSHITVHGIDGAVVGPSITAVDFPTRTFPVTAGAAEQVLSRDEEEVVGRSVLQEDPVNDTDELKAKIRIHSPEVLDEFSPDSYTDREVLLG
jgi:hypothetical protein